MSDEYPSPEEEQEPSPPSKADQPQDFPEETSDDPLDAHYEAARHVVERNGNFGNVIVVGGDFVGSSEGQRRSGVPIIDITSHIEEVEDEFIEPPCYAATVTAIEEHAVALLYGDGCGNRMTGSLALSRTGRKPILELPGALSPSALIEAVKQACREENTGILIDSVEQETLNGFTEFQLRHFRDSLPDDAAVVLTTRSRRLVSALERELTAIEGAPPDAEALIDLIARRQGVDDDARSRAQEARRLLVGPVGPAIVTELVAHAPDVEDPQELAALMGGRPQALDKWLEQGPTAKSVAGLAAAATLDGLPSSDFDNACAVLAALLEGDVEPRTEPATFASREDAWPSGLVTHRPGMVSTYFGWQESEVVEICPPHRPDAITSYLWRQLDGDFRRPFLSWLRELSFDSGARLAFAAARTAGVLFALDPVTIERELLRPWALDGRVGLRNGVALALGIPTIIGAGSTGSTRLLRQWSQSKSANLRKAGIAAYGGPLGVWDPSAAAVSNLWSAGWDQPELKDLANRSVAALFCGGRDAGRARHIAAEFLLGRVGTKDAHRVFEALPLVLQELTGGSRMARESIQAVLSDGETDTRKALMTLLAMAFDTRDGREAAKASIHVLLAAAAAGRLARGEVESLIRDLKEAARERKRLPQLGDLLKQTLKAEERAGGRTKEMARSVYETFYEQGKERELESKR